MNHMEIVKEFIDQSIIRLDEYTKKVERCIEELNEEEIWMRPNENSNSIGNLVLHIHGNITQYIISSLDNHEDMRDRNHEFDARHGYNRSKLIQMLTSLSSNIKAIINQISIDDLLKIRSVQGFRLSGLGIIYHVVEHYSYHTGQIVFWTKLLKNRDLGFYNDLDLNQRNILN